MRLQRQSPWAQSYKTTQPTFTSGTSPPSPPNLPTHTSRDVRSTPTSTAHYQEVHSDDITTLTFNPSTPAFLLSGSTDGLVNVLDTRIADEDDVTLQTFNHNSSIHHAAWLTATEVLALSHDEQFALYDFAEERTNGDATLSFGDLRSVLGCQYVADVTPKMDGSGAIVGSGSQE
jgi:WD repeat-containing protein 89